MKRIVAALFAALFAASIACTGLAAEAPLQVHNVARDFVQFWDATQSMPAAERVAQFKQVVGARFPDFYGIARYHGARTQAEQDAAIGRALDRFGALRPAYLATVATFDADLPRYIASFQTAFPDFQPIPTYFLHSLSEMDGGTRDFPGGRVLIFGADMMAYLHSGEDEAPLFHHELFHVYHRLASITCPQPGMWQPLWVEGLAVYASKMLNPQATEREMTLDYPAGTLAQVKARLPAAWRQMAAVLDDADEALYDPLFSTGKDATGLAPRRGYYLGYLVAQELGKTRDLHALAALECADAHRLVLETVQKLQRQSAPGP